MVRISITVQGEKMRIPVKDNQTVRSFIDDMISRMERLNDPLVAALRAGTQKIGAIVSKSDQRIVASLPADDDEMLASKLDANTIELVAVLASEMVSGAKATIRVQLAGLLFGNLVFLAHEPHVRRFFFHRRRCRLVLLGSREETKETRRGRKVASCAGKVGARRQRRTTLQQQRRRAERVVALAVAVAARREFLWHERFVATLE